MRFWSISPIFPNFLANFTRIFILTHLNFTLYCAANFHLTFLILQFQIDRSLKLWKYKRMTTAWLLDTLGRVYLLYVIIPVYFYYIRNPDFTILNTEREIAQPPIMWFFVFFGYSQKVIAFVSFHVADTKNSGQG